MRPEEYVRSTRKLLVHRGGRFMVSPQMSRREREAKAPPRSLYFRGRASVLGEPPGDVVADLFGIFPRHVVRWVLDQPDQLPAAVALAEFTGACRDWAREHVREADARDCADLLLEVVDQADASGLALFSGWRAVPRPDHGPERLAHALMVARELRGGLHFAALRGCGLGIAEAALLDPDGGTARLTQTGWSREDAEEVRQRVNELSDGPERWRAAEDITEREFARAFRILSPEQLDRLATGLENAVGQ
jgi:hypothetical protein